MASTPANAINIASTGVVFFNASLFQSIAPGASGTVLTSTGVGLAPIWQNVPSGTTIGAFGNTPNANGGVITGGVLTLEPAGTGFPGGLSSGAQSISGVKTWQSPPIYPTLNGIMVANGASPVTAGSAISLGLITSVKVVVLSTPGPGTYTPSANLVYAVVEMIGGGGGGGGTGSGLNNVSAGGGGAGGYSRRSVVASVIGASISITVGLAGTGGAAGGSGTGGTGGTTSFGSLFFAQGGVGGLNNSGEPQGGIGGLGLSGTLNVQGNSGGPGFTFTEGHGGASFFGGAPLVHPFGTGHDGDPATGFGAGGNGAWTNTTAQNFAGGAGGGGCILITEFIA